MQLSLPIAASAIVCGLLFGSFAILANMISFIMIGKINERAPENERISYFWWGTEVRRRFKSLYPDSKLTRFLDLCGNSGTDGTFSVPRIHLRACRRLVGHVLHNLRPRDRPWCSRSGAGGSPLELEKFSRVRRVLQRIGDKIQD